MDTSSHMPIQLTPDQLALLGRWSSQTGKSQEELLDDALRHYQPLPEDSGAPGKSLYDALNESGLIGCLEGGPPDLSTNPKYMEGFGE